MQLHDPIVTYKLEPFGIWKVVMSTRGDVVLDGIQCLGNQGVRERGNQGDDPRRRSVNQSTDVSKKAVRLDNRGRSLQA